MRDWKLLSTITGGHKRSVRCVGWKDYGRGKRRKAGTWMGSGGSGIGEQEGEEEEEAHREDPVVLATGSFDANCGLWVWNREHNGGGVASAQTQQQRQSQNVPGSFGDEEEQEQDFTNDANDNDAEENDEEWHFSTLLTGPDSEIKDLDFSPPHYGANLLATCSRDKSVWVWEEVEPEEWETVAVLSEHTGDVKCVAWLAGARTSRQELRRRLRSRQKESKEEASKTDGNGTADEDEEEVVLGGRELLASGSYDDTIRLHHDDEAEGDWITIAVMTGHEGTVWDLKFEAYVNLASYLPETTEEEVIADWAPRLISCSDDLSVRVWRKQLGEKERVEKRMRIAEARRGRAGTGAAGGEAGGAAIQTGFASNRLPSVIRPPTSTEKWIEEARLPDVHVRSVYAVDWSARTGLVVSCGGDGLIAVYREFTVPIAESGDDAIMNGTAEHTEQDQGEEDFKKAMTEWRVVATMEAAHDEYEINHVCWAPVRDQRRQMDAGEVVDGSNGGDEEYIVSTGDDGEVKIWQLPKEVLDQIGMDL